MSVEERMIKLDKAVAALRHVVRHNGAGISSKADITEVAEHFLDCDPERVKLLWQDIGTIDHVKSALKNLIGGLNKTIYGRRIQFSDLTTEEIMSYGINDERLTANEYTWAVVKITRKGSEIVTYGGMCHTPYRQESNYEVLYSTDVATMIADPTIYGLEAGGNYYLLEGATPVVGEKYRMTHGTRSFIIPMGEAEGYDAFGTHYYAGIQMDLFVKDGNTFVKITFADGSVPNENCFVCLEKVYYTLTQGGKPELLKTALEDADAAWIAETFESEIHSHPAYTEDGEEFIQIPCELPGDLGQLISVSISRTKLADGSEAAPLEYSLTDNSCDTSNEGMVGLPHGMWLIYDNSTLENAPQALLIPKKLADGTVTNFRFDKVKIVYNNLVSGLERLRLVGDSFGDEYIVSTQDAETLWGGTWRE